MGSAYVVRTRHTLRTMGHTNRRNVESIGQRRRTVGARSHPSSRTTGGLRTLCGNQLYNVESHYDLGPVRHPPYRAPCDPPGVPGCIAPKGWGLAIHRTATWILKIKSRPVGTLPMEVGPRTHSEIEELIFKLREV